MSGMGQSPADFLNSGQADSMTYDQWLASLQAGAPTTPTTPTTPEPAPPTPMPLPASGDLSGLLGWAANPYSMYGQYQVSTPLLNNLNNRYGWSSAGIAQPATVQSGQSWYTPPAVWPTVYFPGISGG